MITKIEIKNFKSLESATIGCSNLNVLTGLNGMGKSSVIQALLLLRQSHDRGILQNEGLSLNGELTEVGTVKEIQYEFASLNSHKVTMKIEFNGGISENDIKSWVFARNIMEQDYKDSDFMPLSNDDDIPEYYSEYPLFKNNTFKYLHADRWVKNEYLSSDYNVKRNKYLGKHGEFTTHYLLEYETNEINPDLLYPNGSGINQLGLQVSEWMSEISPGIKVKPEKIGGSNSVKLRYMYNNGDFSTKELTPLNIGFGITYVLSVIVALLSSKSGDILIIENPEAHIHPKGQSIVGKLMAKVAESGVQIFVETHSDHIINGILVSLNQQSRQLEKGISLENLKINFVRRNENSISSDIIQINVEKNGRVKGIPEDFFDQYSKDMKTIIGF